MLQDNNASASGHLEFVKAVCASGVVFALENEEGLATSSSNELEYDDGEPVDLICFWSEKALADACRESDWADYDFVEISLSEFMEDWCVGMSNDGLVIASNFDSNMVGAEVDPIDLLLEIIDYLKQTNQTVPFEKYDSLEEFEQELRDAIEGE